MKRMRMERLLLVVMLFITFSAYGIEHSLTSCSIVENNAQTLIKLKFNESVKYHCMSLTDPDRLVVDLDDVSLKTTLSTPDGSLIKSVRSSDHEHKFLRIVFDLKEKTPYSSAFVDEDSELVIKFNSKKAIDVSKKTSIEKPTQLTEHVGEETKGELDSIPSANNLAIPPEPVLEADNHKSDKNIVIVIDPGHGGKDPGAAGIHGTMEKEVVLKISKQLQSMLNDEPGFCAVLTRTTDYFIPLRKRLAIARKNHADMFIAVHADAYHHTHAAGASVYALSQRGATSEAARWLAEKENESELGGLSSELADKDALLRSVLIDLSQTHTIESSLQIGNNVLGHLGKLGPLHHPKVEQAAFVVLKSPDIPSVLVETGFLSNPNEEQKLTDPNYQQQTAYAIKEGIKQYFMTNSPNGTWFTHNHVKEQLLVGNEALITDKPKKRHRKKIERG